MDWLSTALTAAAIATAGPEAVHMPTPKPYQDPLTQARQIYHMNERARVVTQPEYWREQLEIQKLKIPGEFRPSYCQGRCNGR
jgi:hypothetical protein